jgi:hypothetical protein
MGMTRPSYGMIHTSAICCGQKFTRQTTENGGEMIEHFDVRIELTTIAASADSSGSTRLVYVSP